jgi:hypothetical protein
MYVGNDVHMLMSLYVPTVFPTSVFLNFARSDHNY